MYDSLFLPQPSVHPTADDDPPALLAALHGEERGGHSDKKGKIHFADSLHPVHRFVYLRLFE